MKTRPLLQAAFGLVAGLCISLAARADSLSQTFATWPITTPVTASHNGWSISNGALIAVNPANVTPNTLRFPGATTDPALYFPRVTNGAGTLRYYGRTLTFTNALFQRLDGTTWTTLSSHYITNGYAYSLYSTVINSYSNEAYRLVIPGANNAFVDDITISEPPALLQYGAISALTELGASEIFVSDPVNITVNYSTLGLASNLQMTLFYKFGLGGTVYSNAMTANGPSSFITSTPIPGMPEGNVYYYIRTAFQGPPPEGAVSPTNFPAGGFSSGTYYPVIERPFNMQNNSMIVTGGVVAVMNILEDYVWESIVDSTAASIRFQGVSNGTTRLWGDANPTTTVPAFQETAEVGAAAIAIAPSGNYGQLLIRFEEQGSRYTVKEAAAALFDAWSVPAYGNSTNNGWVLFNGLTSFQSDIRFRNSFAVLNSNSVSWLRSPYLPNGVGEIAFWYRNFNTNGLPAAAAVVEKSVTGGTNDNEWTAIDTVTNVTTLPFARRALMQPDRSARYIRIRSATPYPNGGFCLDEVLVTQPGAAVNFTNVTHSPASPTVSNAVTVSATLTPAGGASNLVAKAWYRSGSTGAWTSLTMTNVGTTYSAVIPAARGDRNGGAGTVQYYLECAYLGFESTYLSPVYSPAAGVGAPLSYVVRSATVQASNPATEPAIPVLGTPTRLKADVIAQDGASNLAVTAYYRINGNGDFLPLATALSNATYRTTGTVPAQAAPGTTLEYYFTTTYQGPDAASPTNYPADAPTTTFNTYFRLVMANDSMTVTGTVGAAMYVIDANLWESYVAYTGTVFTNRFIGVSNTTTRIWGDWVQPVQVPPYQDVGDLNGWNPVRWFRTLPTTNTGYLLYRFNENTLAYNVRQADVQSFDAWNVPATGNSTNNGWVLRQGFTASNAILRLRDRYLVLESNTAARIQTPAQPGGLGEISFWHRNFQSSGAQAQLAVEKSVTGGTNDSEWVLLETVPDISYTDYNRFTFHASDRDSRYVRIRNLSNARVCIDEFMVAQPGAGVAFSGVTNTPSRPASTETVTLSATITPAGGASNLAATAWYRSGSTGTWSSIPMNKSGNTFTTASPVPAGVAGTSGFVQYYIACAYAGFDSEFTSPLTHPMSGAAAPLSFTLQPSWLLATNAATEPALPLIGQATRLRADFVPQAGANSVTATAYYRLGTSGSFTALSMGLASNNTYRTSGSIPAPSTPGTTLQYYFTASFGGFSPVSPTNYPAAGAAAPFRTLYHAPGWTSAYASVAVTGNVIKAMGLSDNDSWRTIVTVTNLNPVFKFRSPATLWGDANQGVDSNQFPVYGTAEAGAGNITATGSVSGSLLYRFNTATLDYSVQKAAYSDTIPWPTVYGITTNQGWVLGGRAGDPENIDDASRVLEGPFLILQGGSSTRNFLRSPTLTNRVGEISFYYRNWYDDGSRPVTFSVETAPSIFGPWATNAVISNVLTPDYQFFRTVVTNPFAVKAVRIKNNSPAIDDRLCLDEVAVSDGGAYVTFDNLAHGIASPTIVDEVPVSVTVNPMDGAYGITPTLWYKAGTSSYGFFESAPMSNIGGNTWQGTIPRGPIGPMFYYVKGGFSGFLSEYTSPMPFPSNAPASLGAYTNSDSGITQNFDTWPHNASLTADYSIDNWDAYNSMVRGDGNFYGAPDSTNKALWFSWRSYQGSNDQSSLISPVINNLYGSVHLTFWLRNVTINPGGVSIYTTSEPYPIPDPADPMWTYKTTIVDNNSTNWTFFGPVDFTNNNFRIMIIKDSGSYFLGIDRVSIAQRSSMITFSNLMLNPGYPGTNEAVTVSCEINTMEPGLPAYNFNPTLFYKNAQGASYQSAPMVRTEDTHTFSGVLPASAQIWDTNTYYYISCQFDGYYHITNLNKSPMYFPTNNHLTEPFFFKPRLKPSDYNRMVTTGNRGEDEMDLLEDYLWQGVLRIDEAVPGMDFVFNGYEHFYGTGFSPFMTNWGKPQIQWKTNLPLADYAVNLEPSGIQVADSLQGQYVSRINERTAEFSLRACVAQDFEAWPTTAKYILSGNNDSENYTESFNAWPLNAERVQFDNFDSASTWTNYGVKGCTYLTNVWYGGVAGWGIYNSSLPNLVGAGVPTRTYGAVMSSNLTPGSWVVNAQQGFNPLEGVGTVSFWYRAFHTNVYNPDTGKWTPTNPIPATLRVHLAPIDQHETPTSWETIATISNIIENVASNSFYMNINTSAYKSVIIEHSDGLARVVIDNVNFTDFAATYFATNGWKASEIWMRPKSGNDLVTTNGNHAAIEFDGRRFNTNAYLQTPLMPNGIGFFDFYYKSGSNTQSVSFDVLFYRGTEEAYEVEKIGAVTNNNTSFTQYSLAIMTNAMGFIRVIPTSTNRLFIDDIRVTGLPSAESWQANNARIASEDGRRFRGTAVYLNNGLSEIDPNLCNTAEWPYLRSPYIYNGIGEISFWYRNHATVINPTPGTLRLQKSITGANGNTNWVEFGVITNIVNRGFLYFRTNLYDGDYRYVRIINDTNQVNKARIILDEVLVAQPMAADLRLTNLRAEPQVPVPTNSVHLYVDVQDQFLFPTNLSLWYDYSVGTNYGAWPVTNSGNGMVMISNNPAARTSTYRSEFPIPAQEADRFVAFQVRAYFDGLNADHTSPKLGREFTTPSYYYPLNFGTNIPYYIVLSVGTNAVWINEIDPGNAYYGYGTPHLYDFVEVAGQAGIDLSNWKIAFLSQVNPTQVVASYTIPQGTTLANMTNGFGFYLLAKSTIAAIPKQLLTTDIPYPGGVALARPSGIYNTKLCFANDISEVLGLTQRGFTYIGWDEEDYFDAGPVGIKLKGSGSSQTAFTWETTSSFAFENSTPLGINLDQTLVYNGGQVNNPPSEVQIIDFWFADNKAWMTVTGTNGWLPNPLYTTNLSGAWTNLPSYERFELDTGTWTYTLRFPIPTNYPAYFYKVVTTNAP